MNSNLNLPVTIDFQSVFAMDHPVKMAEPAACQLMGLLTARAPQDTVVQRVPVSPF